MIVGIDLGTTNSAVAIWRDGQVQMIPNSLGGYLTPSAVSLDENETVIVGLPARDRQVTHPNRTATAFKRFMGTQQTIWLGETRFSPEDLSALVLRSLKADAEAFLGEPVNEAVITVPAYFNDKQRKATRKAGQLAGLKVERLINEPTAAALAYGIAERGREAKFLVFDLGGGTFDVSILEIFEGVLEVRASAGDNRLGGEDFNDLLADRIRARMETAFPSLQFDPRLKQKIRAQAERARRSLSQEPSVVIPLAWEGEGVEMPVTVEDFEGWCEGLIARLRQPVLRALQDGRLRIEEMDEVVLVGGATRMPIVRRTVTRMFGRFPSSAVDPDEAVARGAAIQAGLKMRDAALDEIVLTDVCPYSMGIAVSDRLPNGDVRHDLFAPILERNTAIPASRVKTFHTMVDNQKQIDVRVYQGEARAVSGNILLGQLEVSVPPKPAGQVSVDCRFSYDINGLLEIDVIVPETGERRELVIVDEEVAASDEFQERRAMLAALKVHPRAAQPNLAALARANHCYETVLGDARDHVASLIGRFEAVLEGQDPKLIEQARKELLGQLDGLEGEGFL